MTAVSVRNQAANLHNRRKAQLTMELKCCEESHKCVAEQNPALSFSPSAQRRCVTCTRGCERAVADARLQKRRLHFNLLSSCTADLRKDRRNPGFFRRSLPPQQRLLPSLLSSVNSFCLPERAEARKRNHPRLRHMQSQPSPSTQARALTTPTPPLFAPSCRVAERLPR